MWLVLSSCSTLRPHENVLRFVGACTTPPDLCVVYERHVSSLVAVHDSRPDLRVRTQMACDGKLAKKFSPTLTKLRGCAHLFVSLVHVRSCCRLTAHTYILWGAW